ncbi:MAG: M23 family metallopeptidase [Bacteroidota bacterium]
MKKIFLIAWLCSISTTLYSQTKDSIVSESKPKIRSIHPVAPIASLTLQLLLKPATPKKDWIAEHWNTKLFNPYKKVTKTYPLQIIFDDSTYASPIPRKKVITSRYGWRNRRPHNGIDIDLITGDRVMALFGGVVRYVNYHSGHGKTVVVRHFNGVETVYAHLSKYLVKVNDTVTKGQIIGKGGTTGNARGSHLHLEVLYKGIPIHPEYVFDFSNEENRVRAQEIWITRRWTAAYRHNSKRASKIKIATTEAEAIASKAEEIKIYTVRRGDTLSRISNKYNVSIASLCKANAIRKNSTLRIGQRLIVKQ